MALGATAVSISRAATTKSTLGVATGTTEFLSAPSIIPRCGGGRSCRLGVGLGSGGLGVVPIAARQASSSAVIGRVSTPAVRRAAGTLVDGAIGVTEQIAVGGTALAILGVIGLLLLERWGPGDEADGRAGNFRGGVWEVGNASVALTVLASQADVRSKFRAASWVDPVEADIGRSQTSEAEADERGPHCELMSREQM